ncbi:phosphatidylinositol-specific phospholipase C/glycerophosphodiester phosphodiesterase family protein [Amycolatopsis sp. H20-H5]|uniref:phosphatidylinositol-specific phospholipase C/glycerophosphodiester phosphodiesterase family protein n=1 Tax=Amycolatopsis sp. H20-H5 TaxID=3046309 RepID=UPI002DB938E9|nr:phosphatidylinositol-specific phospholipase C/glycerophosphodiester phosphodiesterase family protein [Amycolatopsis sp. H20-H5]MEC3978567.1 phosphatidylinositol-specific phospholipase C/glycerophosphodiester phosphodiesterase family protein [Amycolatopsis sp. H20-H5]
MKTSQRLIALLAAAVAACALLSSPASAATDQAATDHHHGVRPLPQAHAHNDYEHARPLFDALDQGFTSVEADIYLVDGQLLVGHNAEDLKPERTLEALYLDPLRDRVLRNHGGVYPRPAAFQLLVDVKSESVSTYAALEKRLRDPRYSFLFTSYFFGHVQRHAVTAVLSGNRPKDVLLRERYRLAFYDGRILDTSDLGLGSDPRVTPLVSDNWTGLFTWTGAGPFPAAERARLHELVDRAHAAGQRIRFWATPDAAGASRDALWRELADAGVDHLNTDDLSGLAVFLRGR